MPYHRTAYLKWFKNYFMCVLGYMGMCMYMWTSENNLGGAGPLLLSCDPRDQTQVI